MDNIKSDDYHVCKIKEDLYFIVDKMRDVNMEELTLNEVLLDSMMFRLIQISENANRLSDEYKNNHANIPWVAIYGLRNRIVHDYGNVDLDIIFSTLKYDIPDLLECIENE